MCVEYIHIYVCMYIYIHTHTYVYIYNTYQVFFSSLTCQDLLANIPQTCDDSKVVNCIRKVQLASGDTLFHGT